MTTTETIPTVRFWLARDRYDADPTTYVVDEILGDTTKLYPGPELLFLADDTTMLVFGSVELPDTVAPYVTRRVYADAAPADIAVARRLASDWHTGQASALYSFASTGHVDPSLTWEIRNEVDDLNVRTFMLGAIASAPRAYFQDVRSEEIRHTITRDCMNVDNGKEWYVAWVEDQFDPTRYLVAADDMSDVEDALFDIGRFVRNVSTDGAKPADYGYAGETWADVNPDDIDSNIRWAADGEVCDTESLRIDERYKAWEIVRFDNPELTLNPSADNPDIIAMCGQLFPILVNGKWAVPGCYVDGHWGQYGITRLVDIADDYGIDVPAEIRADLDSDNWDDDESEARFEAGDELLNLINKFVVNGAFDWHDGELFLSSTYGETSD